MPLSAKGTAGFAVLVLFLVCLFTKAKVLFIQPASVRPVLFKSLGEIRPIEGRLAGGYPWGRYLPTPGSSAEARSLRKTVNQVNDIARNSKAFYGPSESGIILLLQRQPREAVSNFEKAVARDFSDADMLNDLAVAYMARADVTGEHFDLALALNTIGLAFKLEPRSKEVHFNRALILEKLSLYNQARDGWFTYLELDPGSPWALEARQHLAVINMPLLSEQWPVARVKLEKAVVEADGLAVRDVVDRFAQPSRIFVQEVVLRSWGEAWLAGRRDEATKHLSLAQAIGDVLAERGEWSVVDSVSCIEQTSSANVLSQLAHAHIAYAKAVEFYDGAEAVPAAKLFNEAEMMFLKGGSRSAALWVKLWLGGLNYFAGDSKAASRSFQEIANSPSIKRFPALLGRALWAIGLVQVVDGCPADGLANYHKALGAFKHVGELENEGAVEALIAEALNLLGERGKSWVHRKKSLLLLRHYPSSLRLHNIIVETSNVLLEERLSFAAVEFQSEGVEVASQTNRSVPIVENLLMRGRTNHQIGLRNSAIRDIAQASKLLVLIKNKGLRDRLRYEMRLAEAEMKCGGAYEDCLYSLSESILDSRRRGYILTLPYAFLLRARLQVALGNIDAALKDLTQGIRIFENAREDAAVRAEFAAEDERIQSLFDEMIRLQVEENRNPVAAFAFAERSRSRFLADSDEVIGQTLSVDELLSSLPKGVSILQYAVLPEQIFVWVIRQGSIRQITLSVHVDRLDQVVHRFQRELASNSSDAIRMASYLYEALLRRPLELVNKGDALVVISDRMLNFIPFGALVDRNNGHFLIEDYAISVAPSTYSYVLSQRRQRELSDPSQWNLLAVGAPVDMPETSLPLASLPGAQKETEEIIKFYPNHHLLMGRAATKSAIRSLLPKSNVLHFAGHAHADLQDPGMSRLFLSPDPREPGGDVLLARELSSINMGELRLVVLSACETAPGSRTRKLTTSGIGGSFLAAGVPAVLATQWRVEDGGARRMAVEFHRYLTEGLTASEALRKAQLKLLAVDGRTRPANWAAFQLIGEAP